MKPYSLISEDDGETFHLSECTGLMQCMPVDYSFTPGFPVTFHDVSGEHGGKSLPLHEIFKLVKIINSTSVEFGYLRCERLLHKQNDAQVYLASLLSVDVKKIYLLDCFVKKMEINFRELDSSYVSSWLSACGTIHFSVGNPSHFSNEISLDVSSLRSKEEFYCYLGEVFFGYAGYAGKDLNGCHEVLQSAQAKGKISVTIKDENKVMAFLADVTGTADYYDKFKTMIEGLGGNVIATS